MDNKQKKRPLKFNKRNKDILLNELQTVVKALKYKQQYLADDNLPSQLTKENCLMEDINYLENEILVKIERFIV